MGEAGFPAAIKAWQKRIELALGHQIKSGRKEPVAGIGGVARRIEAAADCQEL